MLISLEIFFRHSASKPDSHRRTKNDLFRFDSDCNVNIHRNCVNAMQENCVGSVHKKDKTNEKFRKLKERIRPDRDPKRRVSSNWSSM